MPAAWVIGKHIFLTTQKSRYKSYLIGMVIAASPKTCLDSLGGAAINKPLLMRVYLTLSLYTQHNSSPAGITPRAVLQLNTTPITSRCVSLEVWVTGWQDTLGLITWAWSDCHNTRDPNNPRGIQMWVCVCMCLSSFIWISYLNLFLFQTTVCLLAKLYYDFLFF